MRTPELRWIWWDIDEMDRKANTFPLIPDNWLDERVIAA